MNGEAQEADLSGTEVLIWEHFLALRIWEGLDWNSGVRLGKEEREGLSLFEAGEGPEAGPRFFKGEDG